MPKTAEITCRIILDIDQEHKTLTEQQLERVIRDTLDTSFLLRAFDNGIAILDSVGLIEISEVER